MTKIAQYEYCETARAWPGIYLLLVVTLLLAATPNSAAAAGTGPARYEIVQETRTAHIWIVGGWNFEICRILRDKKEQIPQIQDIIAICGQDAADLINSGAAWLYYLSSYNYQVHVRRPLPPVEIRSDYKQDLVIITAWDPLPGHRVTRIEAEYSGPVVCDDYNGRRQDDALICEIPVRYTPTEITAYAISDTGDRSKSILLRIANKVVIGDSAYTQYSNYMDVPRAWGSAPDPATTPWPLKAAPNDSLLTSHRYYYLAGQILLGGGLDGQICPNYGMNGQYSTECGLELVLDQVYSYQNKYNQEIERAAAAYGIPAALIKQVIAAESQFWPTARGRAGENGLYQFTRDGADTLLRWHGPTYVDICSIYFTDCAAIGYDNLAAWQQDVLKYHILADYNNIDYLAAALKANAYQVARLLDNLADIERPANNFSYVELWKITIINYHTGATITAAALVQIDQLDQDYTYSNYAKALERLQPSALVYVNRVFSGNEKGRDLPGPNIYPFDCLSPASFR